jgi:hypothetical protein
MTDRSDVAAWVTALTDRLHRMWRFCRDPQRYVLEKINFTQRLRD